MKKNYIVLYGEKDTPDGDFVLKAVKDDSGGIQFFEYKESESKINELCLSENVSGGYALDISGIPTIDWIIPSRL